MVSDHGACYQGGGLDHDIGLAVQCISLFVVASVTFDAFPKHCASSSGDRRKRRQATGPQSNMLRW